MVYNLEQLTYNLLIFKSWNIDTIPKREIVLRDGIGIRNSFGCTAISSLLRDKRKIPKGENDDAGISFLVLIIESFST